MFLAIDVETSYDKAGIARPWKQGSYLSTVALVTDEGEEATWVFTHTGGDQAPNRDSVADIQSFIDRASTVIGHNLAFDMQWLRWLGVSFEGKRLYDTGIAAYLLSSQQHLFPSLEDLAKGIGQEKMDVVKNEYWLKGVETKDIPLDVLLEYNVSDCRVTLEVARAQAPEIKARNMWPLVRLKMEEIHCVVDIEGAGLVIDDAVRMSLIEEHVTAIRKLEERILQIANRKFNLNSNQHMSVLLYGGHYKVGARCYYPVTLKSGLTKVKSRKEDYHKAYDGVGFEPLDGTELKTPGEHTYYSTDKNVLAILRRNSRNATQKELIDLLLERAEYAKTLSTYLEGFAAKMENGVVYTTLNQVATVTGRFSSSAPNLQNVPRAKTAPVKSFILPRKDVFVAGDAKQLEWRVAAFLSQCPVMMGEIEADIDQHEEVRQDIFGGKVERTLAKIFNFRMIYGGSAYSYYMDAKMPDFSLNKWKDIVDAFYEKYYGLAAWHKSLVREVRKNRGVLVNPTGRRFQFQKRQKRYGMDYHRPEVLNYPVQSLATADIMPLAMVECRNRLTPLMLDGKLIMCLQVHDDIMFDCDKEVADEVAQTLLDVYADLPKLIEQRFGFPFNVALGGEVKVGKPWHMMEEWNG